MKKQKPIFGDTTPIQVGKLPPQAVELEEVVLGALMLERDAITTIIDILKPGSFYKDQNSMIFSAILSLFNRSEPIDILTVANELKRIGKLEAVGGAYYISQLTNRVASSANIEFHARIIAQKHMQRELIRVSSDVIKNAFDDEADVFDLLESAEQDLFHITEGNTRRNFEKITTLVGGVMKQAEAAAMRDTGITGVPSDIKALDNITAGWQNSDLIIFAGRPAMGKTSFVLTAARNAAVNHKKPIAIFSLEMSSMQLVQRLVSQEADINTRLLKTGRDKDDKPVDEHFFRAINNSLTELCDAPIFIDDTPGLSVIELRAKSRRMKQQHDIQMIVVDYLQLMSAGGTTKSGNREQEISTISRTLKLIAKELNVPVIALSQLSRAVELRGGDKRPQLSDLRESGAIEQDADMVVFIHRPEYYGQMVDADGNSTEGLAELIIAKHRNGPIETVSCEFIAKRAMFRDMHSELAVTSNKFSPSAGLQPNNDFMNETEPF